MAIINYLYLENIEVNSIAYLALGYLIGYFVNSIGSLLEGIYYKTIKGTEFNKNSINNLLFFLYFLNCITILPPLPPLQKFYLLLAAFWLSI